MRILIDLTSLYDNFSGIELYACNVTKELIKNNNNYYILVFKNEIYKLFSDTQPNVEKIVIKGKNKLYFQQFKLLHYIKKINADKYLFFAFTQPYFFFNKNTINTIHDVSCFDCKGSNRKIMILYWKLMFKRISRGKNKILTVSNFSKNRINKVLGIDKSRIIVTYSAKSKFSYDFYYDKELNDETKNKFLLPQKYILALSTLEPRKNFRLLVCAYSNLLKDEKIDEDLIIVGRRGWLVDNILDGLDDCVKSRIHFTGFVDDKYLPYIYLNSQLFLFPSKYEGFGVPPLEAMSFKTLVLSSNASAMPEILGDGAIFFDPNSQVDLENKIMLCLNMDSKEKSEIIEKGYSISQQYKWESVADIINREILYNGEIK